MRKRYETSKSLGPRNVAVGATVGEREYNLPQPSDIHPNLIFSLNAYTDVAVVGVMLRGRVRGWSPSLQGMVEKD